MPENRPMGRMTHAFSIFKKVSLDSLISLRLNEYSYGAKNLSRRLEPVAVAVIAVNIVIEPNA